MSLKMKFGRSWGRLGMKYEWKECTIADLGEVVGGATPSTKKPENYENGDISWITPKDLSTFNGRFITRGERNITEIGLNSCSTRLLPLNSVLFSSRAPIGYVAIAAKEMCTNQGFKSVIPNSDTDYMFLYYLLKFNKGNIENMGSGTTFKEVSGNTMKSIKVYIPVDIEEQRKIASILSALDDKIELNNRINENLESQAQAIFKSWFGADIENLNPSNCKSLGELVTSVDNRGKTPPNNNIETPYPLIEIASLRTDGRIATYRNCSKFVTEEVYNSWFRSGHPKQKDILMSTVGSLAELKLFWGDKGSIAQNIVAFRCYDNNLPMYLYQYLLRKQHELAAYEIGSVQASIKVSQVIEYDIAIPPKELLDSFDKISTQLTELIYQNEADIDVCHKLSDTLLQRLTLQD